MAKRESPLGYSREEQERLLLVLRGRAAWRLVFRGTVPSTQDVCRALARAPAERAEHLCVIASHQTAARGTHGRSWSQAPDDDIALSFRARPAGRYPDLLLPFVCAAAVYDAVCATIRGAVAIDWPNDVLAGGSKVAGILIESDGGAWIAGIGLNVNRRSFDGDLAQTATSLALLAGRRLDRTAVLAALLAALASWLDEAERGRSAAILERFHAGLRLLGTEVEAQTAAGTIRGVLRGLAPDGVLIDGHARIALGELRALARA